MISVTILTKNNEKRISQVLDALSCFDQVLLFDTGSTDQTLSIAKKFPNVTIKLGTLQGFGPTHNLASELAKHDWILSIDSDEIVTKELAEEIRNLNLDPKNVYSISRKNLYNGKWIRWCGWHPDYQSKLYNKNSTRFSNAAVHESILLDGMRKVKLNAFLIHYSYESIYDFLDKMQSYSTLFAMQNKGKKDSSPVKAVFHALGTFFKCYLLKRGILGGYEGFLISAYNGHTAFYKYLKLYEANKLVSTRRCPEEKGARENSWEENHL